MACTFLCFGIYMGTTLKLTQIVDEWLAETDILPATKADYRRKIGLWFRWLSAEGCDPRYAERCHIIDYKRYLQQNGKTALSAGIGLICSLPMAKAARRSIRRRRSRIRRRYASRMLPRSSRLLT